MDGKEPHTTSRLISRGGDNQATELKTLVQETIEEVELNRIPIKEGFVVKTSAELLGEFNRSGEVIEEPTEQLKGAMEEVKTIDSIEDISLEEIKEALEEPEIEPTEGAINLYTEHAPVNIIDDPDTDLIETGWTKPNPCFKNGKLYVMSKSDGVQHIFEAETADEAKVIAYTELGLTYDISNLRL